MMLGNVDISMQKNEAILISVTIYKKSPPNILKTEIKCEAIKLPEVNSGSTSWY